MDQVSRHRKSFTGVVLSDKMNKTRVVQVSWVQKHAQYIKSIRRKTKFKAHDEKNASKLGDIVTIVETRPLSKEKCWMITEIRQQK